MPKESGKVTAREREICNRVRLIRKSLKLSQARFSNMLGVSRDLVAGVEYARSPLRFGLAHKLSFLTGFSLKWIVEGVTPEKFRAPVGKDLLEKIPNNYLLSEAWSFWLKPAFESAFKKAALNEKDGKPGRRVVVIGEDTEVEPVPLSDLLEYLVEDLEGNFKAIPPYLHLDFYSHLVEAARIFRSLNSFEITNFEASRKKEIKINLTEAETSVKHSDVKSPLPAFLERIKRAASASGKKSELAKFLDAPLASVSRWLSGEREPGAEITLKMLKWVEQQERQN